MASAQYGNQFPLVPLNYSRKMSTLKTEMITKNKLVITNNFASTVSGITEY